MVLSPEAGTVAIVYTVSSSSKSRLPLFIMNLIYQCPNLADVYPNIAAVLQNHSRLPEKAYASGCSCQEDGAGFESCAL